MNEETIDIRALIGILRRQARLIVFTTVAILVIAAVALFGITPQFRATALLLVDPNVKNLLDPASQSVSSSSESARVDSEVELIRSDRILVDVIRSMNLINDDEFGVKLGLRDKLLAALRIEDAELPSGSDALGEVRQNLRNAISVQRRGLTFLIAVSGESMSPEKAAEIANEISAAYIRAQVQSKIENTLAARDVIQQQIENASQQAAKADETVKAFLWSNLDRIISATGRDDFVDLRSNVDSLAQAQLEATENASRLEENLAEENWNSLVASLESDAAAELAQRRNALVQAISRADTDSADVIDLRAELGRVEDSLVQATNQRIQELKQIAATNRADSNRLRDELNSAVLSSDLPSSIRADYVGLLQAANSATQQYQTLISRMQYLDTQAELQVADSRVFSAALPPTDPSFPNVKLFLALAGIVGVGSGLAAAFVRENLVGGFTSQEHIQSVTKIPLATLLPRQPRKNGGSSLADLMITAPLSRFAERIRKIRAAIDQHWNVPKSDTRDETVKKRNCHIIMITSSLPGEGKTTIALSLARSYALSGKSTLLIDGDLRRPSVHKQIGKKVEVGLADLLLGNIGMREIRQIMVRDPQSSLTAILGNRPSKQSTEHLANPRNLGELLSVVKSHYEYIIIDTSPIEPVVDGVYISDYVDEIAFIVRWASTPQRVVLNSLDMLSHNGEKPIVTVLNMSEKDAAGYGYAYGSYYEEA